MKIATTLPEAVVLGLDCMTGLQTARILAGHGVPVIGLASDARHPCFRTNVCAERAVCDVDHPSLIGTLRSLGRRWHTPRVLFPCTDMSVWLVSRHRDELAGKFVIDLPPHATVDMLMDKVQFTRFAQANGIPIPPSFLLRSRRDCEQAAAALDYPCMLKPALRTAEWEAHAEKVYRPGSAQELLAIYDRVAPYSDMLIAQQWIAGRDCQLYSCNAYFDAASRPLVTFVARKLRQWPPEAGVSSLGEEVRDDRVLAETLRLFAAARFRGLAYVEMKRHESTGDYFVIEPNIGRPTGRSAIAEAGGVELLYTKYCENAGLPLPAARTQSYGRAKWIYFRRDLQSAIYYYRRNELTLGQWAESWRGRKRDALFSWRDPLPFLLDFKDAFLKLRAKSSSLAPGRPRAFKSCSVALVGADGAGKTTIARRLEKSLPFKTRYLYMGMSAESSNVLLPTTRLVQAVRRARPTRVSTTSSNAPRARGWVWAALRTANRIAEELYRQVLASWYRRRGNVVICDRHFLYDFATTPQQAATLDGFERLHRLWLRKAYPRPELVIFLDAPAAVLFGRKGEGTNDYLEDRRRAISSMSAEVERFVRIDTDRSLEAVYADVEQQILSFALTAPQAGETLQAQRAGKSAAS
ncbi:MAG TPA: hypothetical protein VEG32_09455 [Clostridia bacterium]|nr:hypothetical protein [Clostridia bacterium]